MRRTALFTTLAVTTAVMAGCGGSGPDTLSGEDAQAALLTEENFPLDGFSKSESTSEEPDDSEDASFEDFLFGFDDVSDGCKEAGSVLDNTEPNEDSTVRATFMKGDSEAEVAIAGEQKDFKDRVKALHKLADECGELTGGPMGMKVTFEKIDDGDAQGVEMQAGVMGEVQRGTVLGAQVGKNTVLVDTDGLSVEDSKRIMEEQKKAIEEK